MIQILNIIVNYEMLFRILDSLLNRSINIMDHYKMGTQQVYKLFFFFNKLLKGKQVHQNIYFNINARILFKMTQQKIANLIY